MFPRKGGRAAAISAGVLLGLTTAGHAVHPTGPTNHKPHFIKGTIHHAYCDGIVDDLLSAGLGTSGIAGSSRQIWCLDIDPAAT